MVKKIKDYFKERKTRKIAQENFVRNNGFWIDWHNAYSASSKITDEEAIKKYEKEKEKYDKNIAIEKKVMDILEAHRLIMPPLFKTSDNELKEARYILDIKGIKPPVLIDPENFEIKNEEMIASLEYLQVCFREYFAYFEEEDSKFAKSIYGIIEDNINSLK